MNVVLLPKEKETLDDLARYVRARFGDRLQNVLVFGSRARGDSAEDSDLDVAIVIDGLDWKEARQIAEHCGDLLTRYGVLVSPLVMSTERMTELRARERLIAQEIDRDGVPV